MREATTWEDVHGELVRLARCKAAYDADEARWLVEGKRLRVWEGLGYGSMGEYLERTFGYAPKAASERLRVAHALEDLPLLRDELAANRLAWSAVRELTRVVVPQTQEAWIGAAVGKTVREIEQLVSGHEPGDLPDDPKRDRSRRHVIRLEVSGDSLAAFRDAKRALELEVGHALDDDGLVRLMADAVLGGTAREAGTSAYQIALTVCDECGKGTRDGAGAVIAVDDATVEAAMCDGQLIGNPHVGQAPKATQRVPPRIRRQVIRRQHGRCAVPGCRSAKFLELHHLDGRDVPDCHDPSRIAGLCGSHHRQHHLGLLVIDGRAPDGLRFSHADGRPYGAPMPVVVRSFEAEALSALKRLGWKAGEARAAVTTVGGADSVEATFRRGRRTRAGSR